MKAGNVQWQADVFSVESEYHDFMNWPTQEGEGIAAEDVATMARVCVLGTSLAKTLFGDESPLEKTMYIQNVRFRVKGVLRPRGMGPGGTPSDNRLLIPLTTGMRRVFNRDYVSYIRVRMVNAADVPATAERLRTFMRKRHHITPPEEDDFSVVTAAEVEEAARGISGTLTTLLMILVGLSLIVGGVVLMNILLISVAERTKEIGLRRALGATQRDIFQQFLIESLIVTLFGMVAGCALGAAASAALPRLAKMPTVVSWEPFAFAVGFALLVGLLFGVQPARRAARLSPAKVLQ
jgi:putative ABC transport system permease protein